jgi:hypothetical protein
VLLVRVPTSFEGLFDCLLTLTSQFSSTSGELRECRLDLGEDDGRRSWQWLDGRVRIVDLYCLPVVIVILVLPPQGRLDGPAVLLIVVVWAVSILWSNVFRGSASPIEEED